MTQQATLAPAFPVVILPSSPPLPRSSMSHFHLVVFNLDVRNALIIDVNIAKITNVAHLVARSPMVDPGRVEVAKSVLTVVTKVALCMNVEAMQARIQTKNSSVDLCLRVLMRIKKMHLASDFTVAVSSKCTNGIDGNTC